MITFKGRVLNTYEPANSHSIPILTKGGSIHVDSVQSNPIKAESIHVDSIQSNPIKAESTSDIIPKIYKGGAEDFKESFIQFSKESPHLILKAIDEANIHGTFFGRLWGRTFAVILGWVWFLICLIFTCLYYFIVISFVVFIINVVQSGLNIVHGAIRGVLAPLKAMYGVKILNFRPFGFLGGPVNSLQKSDQEIPNTTLELLIKTAKDLLK